MSSIWLRNGFSLSLCIRTTPMLFVSTYISNRKGVNYNSRGVNNIFRVWLHIHMNFVVEWLQGWSFFHISIVFLYLWNSFTLYFQEDLCTRYWMTVNSYMSSKISFRVRFIVIRIKSDGNIVLIELKYVLSFHRNVTRNHIFFEFDKL